MNQILVTGDERIIIGETKKEKKVVPINYIIIFFAISIIIVGICFICGSLYSKNKINETVTANEKPKVEIKRNDEDNTIDIEINHVRSITSISYSWNDEEAKVIKVNNKKQVQERIDLIGGENTLKIEITEENGQVTTFNNKYTVGNIPKINIEAVTDGVKITATSEVEIDYIEYSFDDEEPNKIEVGQKEYEGIITGKTGIHNLKVRVVDIDQMKATKEKTIIGDTEPELKVTKEEINGKEAFIIDAKDDENIKTVTLIHNGGEEQVIEVNDQNYHGEIFLTEGETNTLIVTVTNKNDLTKTKRVRRTI